MGRFGLFEPDSFAITGSSVEGCQFRLDPDGLPERPVERAARDRALEAGQPTAGVGTAAGFALARYQPPVLRHEPQELVLRRLSSAPDAAPDRLGHAAGVPSSPPASSVDCSTGMPAVT